MTRGNINKVVNKIKTLKIQGANAVAKAVLKALADFAIEPTINDKKLWVKQFKSAAVKLAYIRPNEPLAQNAVDLLNQQIKSKQTANLLELKQIILDSIGFYQELIGNNNQYIVSSGVKLIKGGDNILTHCHSSTVEKILKLAQAKKIKFQVFADETRPLYQGRITARNLAAAGIKVTQVADSASGFLISPYSGRDLMMNKIILGADVIMSDGSIVNKIGSYDIAASAYLNKIPVYAAVNLLKYDGRNNMTIERRSDREIWPNKPQRVKILNFAFDVVPARFITGLITEFGIIKPSQAKMYVNKYYPWITNGKKI